MIIAVSKAVTAAHADVWEYSLEELEEALFVLQDYRMYDLISVVKMKIGIRKAALLLEIGDAEFALAVLHDLKLYSRDALEVAPERIPNRLRA